MGKLGINSKQNKAAKILINNIYTDILFEGAVRAGKTFIIVMHLINLCLNFQNIRILIARSIFAHAISSIWLQTLLPILEAYYPGLYTVNKQHHIIRFNHTGAEIWLGGLDTKERADKVFGQEYAIIYLNEATLISYDVVLKVQSRLAQKIDGIMNYMIYDCNPRSPSHWIYQKFYVEKPEGYFAMKFFTTDNIGNISDTLISRLEKMPETERRRLLDAEWCNIVDGVVYRNIYQDHIQECSKDWGRYDDVSIGLDFGYYTAISVWGIKENRAYCIYEKSIINGSNKDIVDYLDSIYWLKKYIIYADHEPDRIQYIQNAGYTCIQADKEVQAGDSTINEFELYFDSTCPLTFQSMLNLMFIQDNDGNWTNKHMKVNDHFADASRYALHTWTKKNRVNNFVNINW